MPLRRKDITFDNSGAAILVDGKTGQRRVRLTPTAAIALGTWLDMLPNKESGSFVWVGRMNTDKHLCYGWADTLLHTLGKKSGIDKSIRPHLLRHSLATFYAGTVPESILNQHFGWTESSNTSSIYVHLSGRQVDGAILSACGKRVEDANRSMLEAVNGGQFPIMKQLAESANNVRERQLENTIGTLKDMVLAMRSEIEDMRVGSQAMPSVSFETTANGEWYKHGVGSVFIHKST